MNRLNWLFTLYSLVALIIIIERLLPSPVLQPYNFIRLHELNQTIPFIGATVILSFFYLQLFTDNFRSITKNGNRWMVLLLLVGTYLYGAGEGWHEVASYTLNTYCAPKNLAGNLCHGLFINDYYTGNIIFFIGGLLSTISLLVLASRHKMKAFSHTEMSVMLTNSVVFALTWFAYSAFDTVLVGLFFSALLMVISWFFFWKIRASYHSYPFVVYSMVAYTLATVGAVVVKVI